MNDTAKKIKMRHLPRMWVKKFGTMYLVTDLDKDGVISKKDYMLLADRIVKSAKLTGEASDRLIHFFRQFTVNYNTVADKVWDKYWVDRLEGGWLLVENPTMMTFVRKYFTGLFQALDFNSDGVISLSEYLHWWKALGLDPSLACMQFAYMDTNHDGKITQDEFVGAAIDYVTNYSDEDTQNRFYGTLIDF